MFIIIQCILNELWVCLCVCVFQYLSKNKHDFHYNELYSYPVQTAYVCIYFNIKSNSNLWSDIFCTSEIYSPWMSPLAMDFKHLTRKIIRASRKGKRDWKFNLFWLQTTNCHVFITYVFVYFIFQFEWFATKHQLDVINLNVKTQL